MRHKSDYFMTLLVIIGSIVVVLVLLAIFGHVVVRGIGFLSWDFFLTEAAAGGRSGGVLNSIIATVLVTMTGVIIATPLGVGTAVYIEEYQASVRFNEIITMTVETMAAIPSIVYGLFGLVFFVIFLGWGWSVLSGGFTLALMVLPMIMRTSQEAIRSVPQEYRENSMALGATTELTISRLILPCAAPAILSGIILAVGRAAGETAAVLLTAGSALGIPASLLDSCRTMPVHLYIIASEGLSMSRAYATALILMIMVLIFNYMVYFLRKRLEQR